MDEFLIWLQDNLAVILSIPGIGTVLLLISNWFVNKELPRWKNALLKLFARLISNMFGMSFDDGEDLVEALPFVQGFNQAYKDTQEKIVDEIGIKLLEQKQKLGSPVYTELEKIPIQAAFDYYYNKYKDQLPQAIIDALDAVPTVE